MVKLLHSKILFLSPHPPPPHFYTQFKFLWPENEICILKIPFSIDKPWRLLSKWEGWSVTGTYKGFLSSQCTTNTPEHVIKFAEQRVCTRILTYLASGLTEASFCFKSMTLKLGHWIPLGSIKEYIRITPRHSDLIALKPTHWVL